MKGSPHHAIRPVKTMTVQELEKELASLPRRIDEASALRDKLFLKVRELWDKSYANSPDFLRAYARAEAAGQEVASLHRRAIQAGGRYREMTSGKLT